MVGGTATEHPGKKISIIPLRTIHPGEKDQKAMIYTDL